MSINKGNVNGLELQPGWSIEGDGFGLLTSRLAFRCKKESVGSRPTKLTAHPEDGRLQCHRSSFTMDGAWALVTAEYVGIESGTNTEIQWAADFTGSTEAINAHPNFVNAKFETTTPLKDLGWDSEVGAFPDDNAVAEANGLVGIKQFLFPQISVSGNFYTSSKEWVQKWVNGAGKTFEYLPNADKVVVISDFEPISSFHDRKSLLTGVGYEMFAHLYKVNFQAKIATGGFHKYVYKKASTT